MSISPADTASSEEGTGLGELTDDALCGPFRIYQRRRGHRYSIDDLVTAWHAVVRCPRATRSIDLGCGIGSVLMMVAYKLRAVQFVGIEALALSFELATKNIERNGLDVRTQLWNADIRDHDLLRMLGTFDLVTGTPPYFPAHRATASPDPQRAAARIELRGGIEAYLSAAAILLSSDGATVVCTSADARGRTLRTAREFGLRPFFHQPLIPRPTKPPLFAVWGFCRESTIAPPFEELPALLARTADGERSEDILDIQRFFDLHHTRRSVNSPYLLANSLAGGRDAST